MNDAFEHYVNLGPARSYSAVAQALGVPRHVVVQLANREGWPERLAQIERRAFLRARRPASESAWHEARRRRDARRTEQVEAYEVVSPSDAVDLLALATQLERAALAGDFDQAEFVVDLLAMRMWRRGKLDLAAFAGGLL